MSPTAHAPNFDEVRDPNLSRRRGRYLRLIVSRSLREMARYSVVLFALLPLVSSASCTLTASPGAGTLAAAALSARSHALAARPGDDVVVCLSPGTYTASPGAASPVLSLTAADAPPRGGGRVVWRGPGAVVSGATAITGWSAATYGGGPAYAATLPPGAPGEPTVVRQLWVAGSRAQRVTRDAAAFLGPLTTWTVAGGGVGYTAANALPAGFAPDAATVASIELSWPIVIDNWIQPRCTLASVDVASRNLTLGEPCGALLVARKGGPPPAPVTVEAVPGGGPLAPGEFFHDPSARRVYYALAPGQTPADLEATATTTFKELLLSVVNATGHAFEGVAFEFATWAQVNSPDGYVDEQSTVFACSSAAVTPGCAGGEAEAEGAVAVAGSTAVSFSACSFAHIGAAWALSVDRGSQNCLVEASNFTDLSGGFLKLGSVSGPYAAGAPAGWDAHSVVADNTADDMAIEYEGAAGLFGGYLFNATISHNAISDAGYDGISCGWGWGASGPLPGHGGNSIVGNRMRAVMSKLRDGGGIYVNGLTQPAHPSLMSENSVEADEAVFAVLYLDNGASQWLVSHNVVGNSPAAWAFFMQGCCNLPAQDSHVENVWWQDPMLMWQNNCADRNCTVDAPTVVEVPADAPLPPAAQAIVDASGPRPARVAAAVAAAAGVAVGART